MGLKLRAAAAGPAATGTWPQLATTLRSASCCYLKLVSQRRMWSYSESLTRGAMCQIPKSLRIEDSNLKFLSHAFLNLTLLSGYHNNMWHHSWLSTRKSTRLCAPREASTLHLFVFLRIEELLQLYLSVLVGSVRSFRTSVQTTRWLLQKFIILSVNPVCALAFGKESTVIADVSLPLHYDCFRVWFLLCKITYVKGVFFYKISGAGMWKYMDNGLDFE
jgi:hypothetical protein